MKRIFLFCLMFLFLPVFPTVHAGEIRFTDALGREIILEKRPERAVSFPEPRRIPYPSGELRWMKTP